MLIGEYIHTIDEKNRMSLPVKFRKELGKKVIITPGLDQCLFIFTMKENMIKRPGAATKIALGINRIAKPNTNAKATLEAGPAIATFNDPHF